MNFRICDDDDNNRYRRQGAYPKGLRMKSLSLLALVVGVTAFVYSCKGANRDSEWDNFGSELANALEDGFTVESLSKNAVFKTAIASNNQALFLEMVHQQDSVLVQIVGFIGISHLQPKRSLEIAYGIILDASDLGFGIYYPVWQAIADIKDDALFAGEFSRAACRHSKTPAAFSLIAGSTPADKLDYWFHLRNKMSVPLSSEATVLLHLIDSYERAKKPLSPEMNSTLLYYKNSKSIFAQYAYVYAIEDKDESYTALLKTVLEDETISHERFLALVYRRKEFISKHLDPKELSLPEERKKNIQKALSKLQK